MSILRILKTPAGLQLAAVALGFILGPTLVGKSILGLARTGPQVCLPQGCSSFDLYTLVIVFGVSAFFFLVGLELKRELVGGALRPLKNVATPLLAAILGMIFPAIWYLFTTWGTSDVRGWPIPTATDVTFALAVFTAFAKLLPPAARTFLLAFAVIDDVLAVLIVTFTYHDARLGFPFGWTPVVLGVAAFLLLVRLRLPAALSSIALLRWLKNLATFMAWAVSVEFTAYAGVEPAVLAVTLALFVPAAGIEALEQRLTPVVNYWILPAFAFLMVDIALPGFQVLVLPVFIGVVFRPVWKFLGIYLGGLLGQKFATQSMRLGSADLMRVAALGGIGFTVALVVTGLAWPLGGVQRPTAILATFIASLVSAVAGAFALRSKRRA